MISISFNYPRLAYVYIYPISGLEQFLFTIVMMSLFITGV